VIEVRAYPDRLWRGELRSVAGDIDPQTRTYPCEVWIDNRDGSLRPGLTARVRVAVFTFTRHVVVPNNAVVTEDQGHYLAVVENGTAVRKLVRIGPGDSTHTVILEGVEPGAAIIVKGAPLVSTGTPVNVIGKWEAP
jgi:multidrug efflux pump subunit AcrA (membrane-fusion protein)